MIRERQGLPAEAEFLTLLRRAGTEARPYGDDGAFFMNLVFSYADGEKETMPVKATLKAMRYYREAFGADLSEDLSEAGKAVHPDVFGEALKKAGVVPGEMSAEEIQKAILANVDVSALTAERKGPLPERVQILILQIAWASIKAADITAPAFSDFCDAMDEADPVSLYDALAEAWTNGSKTTVSLKN